MNSGMRNNYTVLHLIDSGGLYGAENVIVNLSIGSEKLGIRSIVGCFAHKRKNMPDLVDKAESLGLNTTIFRMNSRLDLTCILRIAHWCRSNKVSLIHSHGYKASLICLLLKAIYKIPYIVTCHLWFIDTKRLKLYTSLERISMYYADRVVGVSEEIGRQLNRLRIPKAKLEVIENGIEVKMYLPNGNFDDMKLRTELKLRKNTLVVGSLGRLTEQKDYGTFIKAASEVLKHRDDVDFFVAGNGHLRDKLKALSNEFGIAHRFHFIGFRKDIVPLLQMMDVFVLPSIEEGLPIAMLEAMCSKLPIIATRVGGIPKVIRNMKNGILIGKKGYKQLSDNILLLLKQPDLRKSLGENAFKTAVELHSNYQMTNKYVEIYRSALGN